MKKIMNLAMRIVRHIGDNDEWPEVVGIAVVIAIVGVSIGLSALLPPVTPIESPPGTPTPFPYPTGETISWCVPYHDFRDPEGVERCEVRSLQVIVDCEREVVIWVGTVLLSTQSGIKNQTGPAVLPISQTSLSLEDYCPQGR